MPHVLCCPERRRLFDESLIFLAGPNRWAPPWRKAAVAYLLPRVPEKTIILSPERRDDASQGRYSKTKKEEQMNWEQDHLMAARAVLVRKAVWLFWLPLQVEDSGSHNYGQRTQAELGIAAALQKWPLKIAIGAETGYPGLQSSMHTFEWFSATPPPLRVTLQETCNDALELLER